MELTPFLSPPQSILQLIQDKPQNPLFQAVFLIIPPHPPGLVLVREFVALFTFFIFLHIEEILFLFLLALVIHAECMCFS
jgi:hypothetical protein